MTITPPRGVSGTTRTARNRSRRRAAGADEPRHVTSALEELSPPRRRSPSAPQAAGSPAPVQFSPSRRPQPQGVPAHGTPPPSAPPRSVPPRSVPPRSAPPQAVPAPDVDPEAWPPPLPEALSPEALGLESPRGGAPDLPPVRPEPSAEFSSPLPAGPPARPVVTGQDDTTDGPATGRWRRGSRRAPVRRSFLSAALVRCLLYLGPLSAAVAAAAPLSRVAWPVPAAVLLLGWTAAQALTSAGVTVGRRSGPSAAARLVATGFAAAIGIWCALVWIAPDALLGPDRALAATVGVCGLLTLGSVTAAVVTRAEGAVAGWFVPCWLLAAASAGIGWSVPVPAEILLPSAIVAVTVRAFGPAVIITRKGRTPRLGSADRRRAFAYLVIGAGQAICVTLLWQAGPTGSPVPAALPLLLSVPLLEALIGWHTQRIDAGLDSAETTADLARHVRNVTTITIAGMVPPLAAGIGLAVAAYQLPYGLAAVPGAHDGVLALAAGTLLGGVFAVTFLLAARSRAAVAAMLAAVPPLAAAAVALVPPAGGPLPAAVAVLAATHVAGLLIVALTAAELRRTP